MGDTKIKISIGVLDTTVILQILYVPEKLRGTNVFFRSKDNFPLSSVCCPELDEKRLYVWGNNTEGDDYVVTYSTYDKTSAVQLANRVCNAINEYNNITDPNCDGYIKPMIMDCFFNKNTLTTTELSFDILRWGNVLAINNTGINDSDRGTKCITHKNFSLRSKERPSVDGYNNVLYVRGTNVDKDNYICIKQFGNAGELLTFLDKLAEATKKWNCSDKNTIQINSFLPY